MTTVMEPPGVPAHEDSAAADRALAERWQQGDHAAAESLIRRYLPRLHGFVAARAASTHEAEDVTQEVFAAVSRQIARYRPELPFAAWIYGIARRKIADAWRGHRPVESFEPRHEGVDERTPARLRESAEDAAALWAQAFARLPEAQASALWLRVQEDLPLEAIADSLGVTVANAKVLLFRARQTLAHTWKDLLP